MRDADFKEKREEGYVVVTVAVLGVVLIGFAALAIDMGALYGSRTTAQKIADAAAIAGVSTFVFNPIASQPGTARHPLRRKQAVGLRDSAEAVQFRGHYHRGCGQQRVTVDITGSSGHLPGGFHWERPGHGASSCRSPAATALGAAVSLVSSKHSTASTRADVCASPDFDESDQVLVKNGAITELPSKGV